MDPHIQSMSHGHFETSLTRSAHTGQKLGQLEAFHFLTTLKSEKKPVGPTVWPTAPMFAQISSL